MVEFNPFYKGPPRGKKSRTKQNPQRVGKDPLDRYYTPAWAVDVLADDYPFPRHAKLIWEPCAGRGDIVDALKANKNLMQTHFDFFMSDVDPESGCHQSDFLALRDRRDEVPDEIRYANDPFVIITNPPYSIPGSTAADFVRIALEYTPYVAMLLRMTWTEKCEDRADIFDTRPPHEIRAISPRVPFEGPAMDGKKQAPNGISAWFIWQRANETSHTKFTWVEGKP